MHSYILCFCPCTLQDMLPEYIHMRVAESILFAGKAIRVLRNPSPGATLQEHVNQGQNPKGSHRMQSFTGGSGAPKDLPNFSNISAEELLPLAEADKIDAMLKDLKVSYQPGNYCQQCLFHHHILLHAFHCFAFTQAHFFYPVLSKKAILMWAYGCFYFCSILLSSTNGFLSLLSGQYVQLLLIISGRY